VQKQEEHGKRDLGDSSYDLEARDGIGDIFSAIASLFARIFVRAVSAAARFATRVAGKSARLAKILEKEPARLFKSAARGKGASLQGMRNAASKLKNNKYLKNCVESALPGI
jgi:hypothetical protein